MSAHEQLPGGALDEAGYAQNGEGDDDGPGGIVARMRSSLHLSRMSTALAGSASTATIATHQSGATGDSGGSGGTQRSIVHKRSRPSLASTFGRRRPKTAPPSSHGSTSPPGSVAGTVVPERGDGLDLTRLVRISLLQTTYCTSTGPSDMPRVRRRVISLAELEELDIASIVGPPTSPSLGGQESTSSAASRAVLEHAQGSGVRLLRGMVRVGRDLTPGFRCQGIEVKYALKVDLLPFSPRQARRRPASGGGANRGGPSISEALRSINEDSRSGSHRASGYAESAAGFSTSGSGNFGEPPRTPPMPSPSYRGSVVNAGSPGAPSYRGGSPGTALGSPVMGSDARSFAGGAGPMSVVGGTVYDEDGSVAGKIDKTVGSLWVDVRLLRSSMG
jgi:hypothetical protein